MAVDVFILVYIVVCIVYPGTSLILLHLIHIRLSSLHMCVVHNVCVQASECIFKGQLLMQPPLLVEIKRRALELFWLGLTNFTTIADKANGGTSKRFRLHSKLMLLNFQLLPFKTHIASVRSFMGKLPELIR